MNYCDHIEHSMLTRQWAFTMRGFKINGTVRVERLRNSMLTEGLFRNQRNLQRIISIPAGNYTNLGTVLYSLGSQRDALLIVLNSGEVINCETLWCRHTSWNTAWKVTKLIEEHGTRVREFKGEANQYGWEPTYYIYKLNSLLRSPEVSNTGFTGFVARGAWNTQPREVTV